MERIESILAEMRSKGLRCSRARESLLTLFFAADSPLSAPELLRRLGRSGRRFNKTTVYRELEILKAAGYVKELTLRNDIALYELAGEHHHHLVCVGCGEVRDVDSQQSLSREERRLERTEGFCILEHSLEFIGLCARCR